MLSAPYVTRWGSGHDSKVTNREDKQDPKHLLIKLLVFELGWLCEDGVTLNTNGSVFQLRQDDNAQTAPTAALSQSLKADTDLILMTGWLRIYPTSWLKG